MSSNGTYLEPARRIPVMAAYDVAVCGGGPAGCAAALSASRLGARTLLLEKNGYLGGATVSQLVISILTTNCMDLQGVWHEFMRALKQREGVTELKHHEMFDYILCGSVDPEAVKFVWDDLLSTANVDILHHVWVTDAIVEDNAIRGVVLETRAGRRAILAKRVIDCTGDGTVCDRAGVPWQMGTNGKNWAMAVSRIFRYGNVPNLGDVEPGQKLAGFGRTVGYRPECIGINRVLRVDPLDPWSITRSEREGRAIAWQMVQERRKEPGCADLYLVDTANEMGVRSSRRIRGTATCTEDDAWNFRKYADSIARCSWDIDCWPAESKTEPPVPRDDQAYQHRIELMKQGEYFDIRYGCIVPERVENLLVAGRCISADHLAQASLRIQQTCMSTGQAAGTAAALSLVHGMSPRTLDVMHVVKQLTVDRVRVEPAFPYLNGAVDMQIPAKGVI